jgi:hypothetical protein
MWFRSPMGRDQNPFSTQCVCHVHPSLSLFQYWDPSSRPQHNRRTSSHSKDSSFLSMEDHALSAFFSQSSYSPQSRTNQPSVQQRVEQMPHYNSSNRNQINQEDDKKYKKSFSLSNLLNQGPRNRRC